VRYSGVPCEARERTAPRRAGARELVAIGPGLSPFSDARHAPEAGSGFVYHGGGAPGAFPAVLERTARSRIGKAPAGYPPFPPQPAAPESPRFCGGFSFWRWPSFQRPLLTGTAPWRWAFYGRHRDARTAPRAPVGTARSRPGRSFDFCHHAGGAGSQVAPVAPLPAAASARACRIFTSLWVLGLVAFPHHRITRAR
jgi:hypothetical protein